MLIVMLAVAGVNVNPWAIVITVGVLGILCLGGMLFGHGGSIHMEVPYEQQDIEKEHPNATVHWSKVDPDGTKRSMTNKGGRSYIMVKKGDPARNPDWSRIKK